MLAFRYKIVALVVVALTGGCNPVPAPSVKRLSAADSCVVGTAQAFTDAKVRYLPAGYNLGGNGYSGPNNTGVYSPPVPDDTPVDAAIVADIQAAYNDAPCWLKLRLAQLTNLFIDKEPSRWGGWGFWEVIGQGLGTGVYIGIAANYWTGSPPRATLLQYDNLVTGALLYPAQRPAAWPPPEWPGAPTYTASDQDTVTKTLLGMIAHEWGHIEFRDGSAVAAWTCGQNETPWLKKTWTSTGFPLAQNATERFHQFGEDIPGSLPIVKFRTPLTRIRSFVAAGKFSDASAALEKIYGLDDGTPNWASLFARVAPDEDFAETLTLLMLSKAAAPVTSLQVTLEGATIDLMADGLNTQGNPVYRKGNCMQANLHIQ